MKIVLFTPGLGNQLFQYLFVKYLEDMNPQEQVYGYYNKNILNKHNGLEVQNVFRVELPKSTIYSDAVCTIIRSLNMLGIKSLKSLNNHHKSAIYYDGFWQDKEIFKDYVKDLSFRTPTLRNKNLEVYNAICESDSVSIHIRRGDYCDPVRSALFSNSCPPAYYENAISLALKKMPNAKFFVFSDDIPWVKDNIVIPSATFVDWNKATDSYLDMYLMSQCKASIIANSTFSFWGACLETEKSFVIRPKKWIGDDVPNIFPNNWIAL